jgi:hypothetical protein
MNFISQDLYYVADYLSKNSAATTADISLATGIRKETVLLLLSKNPDYFSRIPDTKPCQWVLLAMPPSLMEGVGGFILAGGYAFPTPLETGVSEDDLIYLAGCYDLARSRGWRFKPARYNGKAPRVAA